MDIKDLLSLVSSKNISDLHLSAGLPPLVRVDGEIEEFGVGPLGSSRLQEMLFDILTDFQKAHLEKELDLDFAFQLNQVLRFRVNVFYQERGISAVFRKIPTEIKALEDLGILEQIKELSRLEKGLVLVTGPTGSGKSTTLASLINKINTERAGHIITIEDPIEFIHSSKRCLVSQRELGSSTRSFSKALRAALREDPDYILVGEMRDLETIHLALTAAETGHLVFATLHTSGAAKSIDRVIDVFPASQQSQVRSMLSESLQAIISQTLCKKVLGGRVAAFEILLGTTAVRNLIREGKTHQLKSVMQTSLAQGMQTLERDLRRLLDLGVISQEVFNKKISGWIS